MFAAMQRRIAVVAASSMVLLWSANALAQGRWVKGAPFPEPSEEVYGIAANGKLYVFGGIAPVFRSKGLVYEYDPATDKWTKKKPMTLPSHHVALVEYRGKIYVIGGFVLPANGEPAWEPINNTWEYDPPADSWKALAPMPTKRGSPSAVEFGGKIYVIGGAGMHPGSKLTAMTANGPHRSLSVNEVYDPATNKWETRSPMPTARNHAAIGAVNGKIYVIGGRVGAAFMGVATNIDVVEQYDPASDQWGAVGARMPTARSGVAWGVYNGRIYVAGGEFQNGQMAAAFRAFEAYEPATNRWFIMPQMPIPRHGVAAGIIGNRFHLVGGAVQAGGTVGFELAPNDHDIFEIDGAAK